MVKVSELEDGDLERIAESQKMLAEGKTEAEVIKFFVGHGFIPYHVQFIVDIAAGRIPLEVEVEEDVANRMAIEAEKEKRNIVIALIIGGVLLAIIAGLIFFQLLQVT